MATADQNPFRVTRIEALSYRAPDFVWRAFLKTLADHDYRGAIVGPHGSGKTTLLLETQARLEAMGIPVHYGFLNEQRPAKRQHALRCIRETPPGAILFLDGAEQLDLLSWWWVHYCARPLRGLVLSTHVPGRLPTLYQTAASEAVLRELLVELVPDTVAHDWPRARDLFVQHQGNIRAAFFALYDDYSRHP